MITDTLRALVRPVALLLFVVVNLALLLMGVFRPEARDYIFQAVAVIEGPTLLILGFWFKERSEKT